MKKSGTFKKERPPFLKSGKKRGPLLCLCQVGSCSRRATPCKVATTSHATLARSLSAPRAGAPASYAFTEPMSKRQSKRKSRHAEPPSISKHGTPRLIRRQPSAVTILSRWCYRQIYSVKNILEVFFVHIVLSKCLFARNEREGTRENIRGRRDRDERHQHVRTRAKNSWKNLHSILLLLSLILPCLASLIISSRLHDILPSSLNGALWRPRS